MSESYYLQGARQGEYITRGSDCPRGLGIAANVATPLLNNALMLMEKESDLGLRFPGARCSFHIIIPRVQRMCEQEREGRRVKNGRRGWKGREIGERRRKVQ